MWVLPVPEGLSSMIAIYDNDRPGLPWLRLVKPSQLGRPVMGEGVSMPPPSE
jgi:hypothetical protein